MPKPKLHNPNQIPILVYAQATYYPDMVSIYIPKQPIVKHGSGYEEPVRASKYRLEDDLDALSDETNSERSVRRTKKIIRDYVLCNCFDMFATFTFKSDRQDIEKTRQKMMDWLKNQRNRNGRFRYLLIPEFHKDGQSLHFHALFGDYPGKIKKSINKETGKLIIVKGQQVYELTGYTLGFNNVKLIPNNSEDFSRVSSYIQKYITKDMPNFHGKQRYWASKGLLLPNVEDNPEKWYERVTPDWSKEFENGTLLRFNLNSHPLTEMFLEPNQ